MWKLFLVPSLCCLQVDLLDLVNKEVEVGHSDNREHDLEGRGVRSEIVVRNKKLYQQGPDDREIVRRLAPPD